MGLDAAPDSGSKSSSCTINGKFKVWVCMDSDDTEGDNVEQFVGAGRSGCFRKSKRRVKTTDQ
jgi:hypothetical protein